MIAMHHAMLAGLCGPLLILAVEQWESSLYYLILQCIMTSKDISQFHERNCKCFFNGIVLLDFGICAGASFSCHVKINYTLL
jgi:hypothetical protein